MKKLGLLGSSALRSVAVFGVAMALANPAFAQEVAEEEDPAAALDTEQEIESGEAATPTGATGGETIEVTGSRIRRPNLVSTVPITSVSGEEFFQTGQISVGDVLNELPALKSTFSQSNSSRFLGTAGLSLLDLRGLDTQRTLVLQNGRRHVGADILNYATSVDVNMIPTDLIERVDIVTGGNSAIYGSDAIAGVVNFVLKRDFEGLQVRGQGGISKYGDMGSYYVSVLAGTNFGGDRGNVAINAEYARQNTTFASRRPNLSRADGFIQVDFDDPGQTDDGVFDNAFFQDIRNPYYSEGGTFLTYFGGPLFPDYVSSFEFQPDGTLRPQTGTPIGADIYPAYIGGSGPSGREGTQFGLIPQLDRYSFNALGHFTVSEAFEPFFEAKYVRVKSVGNASGPYFTGGSGETFFTDNPFLNPQTREFIRDYYGVTGDDETGFIFYRNVQELGNREEYGTRETYRLVGGVRGRFNDDWSYEVSANYGEFRENTRLAGNLNLQRYQLAIDAVRNPAGQIVCRSQIDPAARNVYSGANAAYANAQLAADVAACVPLNLFGVGNVTDAARDYVTQDSFGVGRIKQLVVNGFVSGDSSALFELPGGPIGFALGAEYRREQNYFNQDAATASGITFYNAIGEFDPPSFEVKEAFGEIRIPILSEMPFFHELTLSAAGRVSDYKGAVGTTYAYNAGVDWAPVRDVRFRGNYSRAVRAPNLVDAFFPLSQNFAPGFEDPCSLTNIAEGSATRAANCAADGVPAGYNYQYLESLQFRSGGNPFLSEESSDSYTLGAVIQPRFLPGFAITVDYYDITVNDVIASVSAQNIVNNCYDAASIDNQFCELFERFQGPGQGPSEEIPGRILEDNLIVGPVNFAKLKVRGIDFDVSYRHNFSGIGTLQARLNYTRVLQNDQFLNINDPERADQILLELGEPRDSFNFDLDLKSGPFTIGYELRYIGKMTTFSYESFFSKQGREPENPDAAEIRFYPDTFFHDVRLGIDAGDKFNFYLGVDNVLDREAPLGLTGIGAGSGIYGNRGRFFYAGAVAKF
jgi:outer membrane receptor protein involved in Fe transport